MDAIVLAGGMGTRLREVVSDVPKPMAPLKDKPFLKVLLTWLSGYSVDRIILAVGYKADVIRDYFGEEFLGKRLVYAEETEPLGTGGGIFNALKYTQSEKVLIVNGDTYFPIDLNAFEAFHEEEGSGFSIALKRMTNFERYGTVDIVGETVVSFNEKQFCAEGLINGGIYLINKNIFREHEYPVAFSFEKEILEKEALSGKIKGVVFEDSFIDIGIPEDYHKAYNIL